MPPPLLELVGAGPLYAAQLAVALLGAVAGLLGLSRPASPLLAVAGALQVAVFGLGFASFLTLAATGYLIALAMPLLLLTIGLLGFAMRRFGWPVAPAVVGLILGPVAETNLRRALSISDGDLGALIASPFSKIVLLVTVLALIWPLVSGLLTARSRTVTTSERNTR